MQNEKTIALIILALVAIVTLTGFMLVGMDINAQAGLDPSAWGRGGQYSEDAAEWNWQTDAGGRGRRFIEDAG